MKTAIIIPARLASTRLPNKPLADILGQTMISRVYNKAKAANIGDVIVACDCEEIASEITKIGGRAVITDPDLPSGTDRIYVASQKIAEKYDIIINLQGDLPNIDESVIKDAADTLINGDADIATLASKITNLDEIQNPNVVKIAVAFDENNVGNALYFSRSAIPYGSNEQDFYHHIGIYAYKANSLQKFVNLAPSSLEKREKLEQLRALENNMKIAVKLVDAHPLSVDTKEDLQAIIKQIQ